MTTAAAPRPLYSTNAAATAPQLLLQDHCCCYRTTAGATGTLLLLQDHCCCYKTTAAAPAPLLLRPDHSTAPLLLLQDHCCRAGPCTAAAMLQKSVSVWRVRTLPSCVFYCRSFDFIHFQRDRCPDAVSAVDPAPLLLRPDHSTAPLLLLQHHCWCYRNTAAATGPLLLLQDHCCCSSTTAAAPGPLYSTTAAAPGPQLLLQDHCCYTYPCHVPVRCNVLCFRDTLHVLHACLVDRRILLPMRVSNAEPNP